MKKIKILILLTLLAITSVLISNTDVNASGNIGFRVTAKINETSNISMNDFVALGGPEGMGFTLDLYLTALGEDRSLTTIQTNVNYDETLFEDNVQANLLLMVSNKEPVLEILYLNLSITRLISIKLSWSLLNNPIKFFAGVETKVVTIPFWSTVDADFSNIDYTEIFFRFHRIRYGFI